MDHLFIGGSVPSSVGGSSPPSAVDNLFIVGSCLYRWIIPSSVDHGLSLQKVDGPLSRRFISLLVDHPFINMDPFKAEHPIIPLLMDHPYRSRSSPQP
jgi:hypothetical protein